MSNNSWEMATGGSGGLSLAAKWITEGQLVLICFDVIDVPQGLFSVPILAIVPWLRDQALLRP